MKNIILYIVLFMISSHIHASEIVDLAGEIRIPLPENWEITGDSGYFPFQAVNTEQTAELLIYKSIITQDEKVHNEKELKKSVDFIIEDIILDLPEAKLLTTTGRIDFNRAIFSLEFRSQDTVVQTELSHRLNGYLYEDPNGDQILFTLWGKTSSANEAPLHSEILFMQENFAYYGDSKNIIFQPQQGLDWKVILFTLFIIVTLLIVFKKQKANDSIKFSDDSHFWRCACGRQNHNNHKTCQRCGQKHEVKESA